MKARSVIFSSLAIIIALSVTALHPVDSSAQKKNKKKKEAAPASTAAPTSSPAQIQRRPQYIPHRLPPLQPHPVKLPHQTVQLQSL